LPVRCIAIENKFGHCNNGDWKNLVIEIAVIIFFEYCSWADRKFLVIKIMTIETFWSTFLRWSKFFRCHLCDNQIVLVGILYWVIKIKVCISNSFPPLRWVMVGFVLFNKQWLLYIFGRRCETFVGV
jgi:hypothetical protein